MAYTAWSVVFGEQPSASKWNILGTNDAHFYDFLGASGAYATWAVSWTNLTVGDGTTIYGFKQIAKTVFYRIQVTFGSTTSISGAVSFSLPVTASSGQAGVIGWGYYVDASSTDYYGPIRITSTTEALVQAGRTDVTNLSDNALAAAAPIPWTTTDKMIINGNYEAA